MDTYNINFKPITQKMDSFQYFSIPYELMQEDVFKNLSHGAILLYGMMLDRITLSIRNKWQDSSGRPYIYFSIEEIMEVLNCCKSKAIKCLAELDSRNGIGLIEKKKMGLGMPNRIYVNDFRTSGQKEKKKPDNITEKFFDRINEKKSSDTCALNGLEETLNKKTNLVSEEGYSSVSDDTENGIPDVNDCTVNENEIRSSEVQKIDFKELEACLLGEYKTDSNHLYNDNQYKDIHIQSNPSDGSEQRGVQNVGTNMAVYPCEQLVDANRVDKMRVIQHQSSIHERMLCEKMFKKNIEYDVLCQEYSAKKVDEIVSIAVDSICSSNAYLPVNGGQTPAGVVKSRLMKINYFHMQYIFQCFGKVTSKIRNIRRYLLTVLYNAPATMDCFYEAEVQHDMAVTGCV